MSDDTKLYDANLVELCHAMQKRLDGTQERELAAFWLGWSQGMRSRLVSAWPDLQDYAPDVSTARSNPA